MRSFTPAASSRTSTVTGPVDLGVMEAPRTKARSASPTNGSEVAFIVPAQGPLVIVWCGGTRDGARPALPREGWGFRCGTVFPGSSPHYHLQRLRRGSAIFRAFEPMCNGGSSRPRSLSSTQARGRSSSPVQPEASRGRLPPSRVRTPTSSSSKGQIEHPHGPWARRPGDSTSPTILRGPSAGSWEVPEGM